MEHLQDLMPKDFRELFSFFSFFIGLIFAFISLSKNKLEHSLRMASILFIVSVSLFASNGWCYFGAIFIIATAVTQLDFLQNLAAIIRSGGEKYFDYRQQQLKNEGGQTYKPNEGVTTNFASTQIKEENETTSDDLKLVEASNSNDFVDKFLSNSSVIGVFALYAVSLSKKHKRPFSIGELCRQVKLLSPDYTNGFLIAASSMGLFSRASYSSRWTIAGFDSYLMSKIKEEAYVRKDKVTEEAEYLDGQLKLIESFFGE